MATREQLVDAGVGLLEAEGLSALSLRRIASAAGMSHGAPRHHFPTYASLLAAIARSGIDDLDARFAAIPEASDPPSAVEAVRAMAEAYLEFSRNRPEMFALMARHDILAGAGENLRAITAPWVQRLGSLLSCAAGQEASEARVMALWSGVHGLAVLTQARAAEPTMAGASSAAEVLDTLVDAFVARAVD